MLGIPTTPRGIGDQPNTASYPTAAHNGSAWRNPRQPVIDRLDALQRSIEREIGAACEQLSGQPQFTPHQARLHTAEIVFLVLNTALVCVNIIVWIAALRS